MPLGFERLNERQQRPNSLINFIKPLEGPDKPTSLEFLSRIAAQCFPVMKKHHISVMALEEHEQNPEFLGRNFNAGEVIQLVLKDRQGRWLSMKFVQMVMMHELAHCKQMNHSRFFWNVRNDYAKQMEGLWRDGYIGEGIWGRGRGLKNGAFVSAAPPDNTQIPAHLCGGSYRRRGKKRKRGQNRQEQPEKLTYAERQQRRIARKFGKHGDGESLGDDELVRGALETMNGGKRGQGRPKVASSKRGRELRAAAALARFEQAKRETPEPTPDLEDDMGSETESELEEDTSLENGREPVVISDSRGRDLVKVCGDGEDDEEGAGKEMDELRMLSATPNSKPRPQRRTTQPLHGLRDHIDSETEPEEQDGDDDAPIRSALTKPKSTKARSTATHVAGLHDFTEIASKYDETPPQWPTSTSEQIEGEGNKLPIAKVEPFRSLNVRNVVSRPDDETPLLPAIQVPPRASDSISAVTNLLACPICSLENDSESPTCMACSNVLRPKLIPNHWSCNSEACKGSKYTNAGDVGRCGICGAPKPKAPSIPSTNGSEHPIGITRPEVLRWD